MKKVKVKIVEPEKPDGFIRAEGMALDGCPVKIADKKFRVNGMMVELLENRGAYKIGDKVQIGTGEFIQN